MVQNNISMIGMMVRPIDPSSKLSYDSGNAGLFDGRHDFIAFNSMTHIAVLLLMSNDTVNTSCPVPVNTSVTVSLVDTTLDQVVVTRKVKVSMADNEPVIDLRADLPFTFADAECSHAYNVTVCVGRNREPVVEHEIHLFRLSDIRLLPTKWFVAESGFVDICFPWSFKPMRSLGAGHVTDSAATFMLRCKLPSTMAFIPELEMRMVYPGGREVTELVGLRPVENGDSDMWKVLLSFRLMENCRGVHYVEVRCMGHAFAGMLFSTEGEAVEGEWTGDNLVRIPEYTPFRGANKFRSRLKKILESESAEPETDEFPSVEPETDEPASSEPEPKCDGQKHLDSLTGLANVKRKIVEYESLIRFSRMRTAAGLPMMSVSLHSMFLGSPGTGKTTVAKIMGQLLHSAGMLSKGHVVVRERATLIGKYYNSESENVKNALEEAQGGILFIDEAYQLHQPEDPKDPGRFVIETLLTALADETNRDWMLILAGYSEPMMRMFEINPGLRSRIPDSNIYVFEDFSEGELMEIAEHYFNRNSFRLTADAHEALRQVLASDYANRGKDFGNARHVMNLIQNRILPNMAMRLTSVASPSVEELSLIVASDMPRPAEPVRVSRPTVGFRTLPLVS